MDQLTTRECLGGSNHTDILSIGSKTCSDAGERQACIDAGGECLIIQDGYYVETVICSVLGIIWFLVFYRRIMRLQNLKITQWRVKQAQD